MDLLIEADDEATSRSLSEANPGYLIWGHDAGGRRAFLAGREVVTGAGLEVLIRGEWVPGRLECTYFRGEQVPYIILTDDNEALGMPHAGLRVRRPERR